MIVRVLLWILRFVLTRAYKWFFGVGELYEDPAVGRVRESSKGSHVPPPLTILYRLPQEVQMIVLNEYLDFESIMQFDFACTSSSSRPILLSTLRRITTESLPPINSIKNLSYIASRRLQPTMGNNARHLKIEIQGVSTPSQLWFAAAQRKQYLAMKMVLSIGDISPNHTDCAGRAAQHNAALFNQVEMMQHLQTSLGCDHTLGDNNGDTPLHIAARFNRLKSAEFLINTAGVSSTVENNHGTCLTP
jgi:hypothetical protein